MASTSRRWFLGTLTASLLAASRQAASQQAGKTFRIGYLVPSTPAAVSRFTDAFRQGPSELADPVGLGPGTSLAHRGGNVTGSSYNVGMDTFDKE